MTLDEALEWAERKDPVHMDIPAYAAKSAIACVELAKEVRRLQKINISNDKK